MRPLLNDLDNVSFDGQRLQHRGINGDGRTDRASLQDSVTASIESEERPLCQRLQHRGINGDGRSTVRPYRAQ